MFGMPVRSIMQRKQFITVPPETTVAAAALMMARKNVGAVMVVRDERLIGIFTERDAVYRVIARDLDPHTTALADVMTRAPKTVSPDESFGAALLMMHENGFRHAPVLEHGRLIGVVSARNALDPDLEEFRTEARRREHFRRRHSVA